MLRPSLSAQLLTLTVATALLGPLPATAQTPPAAPTAPAAAPATPAVPDTPTPKKNNRVRGKISTADTAKKTITLVSKRSTVTLSVPDDAKIYKPGDAKGSPTGTFADLLIDTNITAQTDGDETAPVAKVIHIRAPKTAGAAPAAPVTPAPAP